MKRQGNQYLPKTGGVDIEIGIVFMTATINTMTARKTVTDNATFSSDLGGRQNVKDPINISSMHGKNMLNM